MTTPDSDRWRRIRVLFEAASELTPAELPEYLDRECTDDPELRQEVESLLEAVSDGTDLLGRAVQRVAGDLTEQWVPTDLEIGDSIGKYRILHKLGEGGMGAVFVAEDSELGRKVALKIITGSRSLAPDGMRRLRREARALATLDHPNIVTIYSVEHEGDLHFLTMELLEGSSLDRVISSGPLETDRFLELAIPLAEALAAAHDQGITHRDLKPANVMLSARGDLKILDFGLAKLRHEGESIDGGLGSRTALTRTGIVMGTVPYMSPEQAEGKELDHRTDLFSLGAILYEMATGTRPFEGDSSAALISSILKETPAPATTLNRRLPPRLGQIISRCLEKDRRNRYQDAALLAKDLAELKDALEQHPKISSGIGRVNALLPRSRRLRLGILSFLAAVTLIGLVLRSGVLSTYTSSITPTSSKIASLAVLPLTNLSGDQDQEYLADGMTEILITELSKISSLRVISRTSVMRFKDTQEPMTEIANELGIDAVIEGSVLRSDNRVRVTAQLIHAISDEHLWADSFERDMRDLFALQGEVARAIARQVEVTLTPEEEARLARGETVDPAASEAYLRGRNSWNQFDFVSAVKGFQQAIDLDPDFARAHAGLAHARQMQGVIGFPHPPKVAYAEAKSAASRALELDDQLAEAHAVAGSIAFHFDRDWDRAQQQFERALELNPGERYAHTGLGYLHAAMGRLERALESAELARELDPLAPMSNVTVGEILYFAGLYERALFQLGEQWDLDFRPIHWLQSRILHAKGDATAAAWADFRGLQGFPQDWLDRLEEALTSIGFEGYWREMLEIVLSMPQEAILAKDAAEIHVRLGELDLALEWLGRAIERHDPVAHLGVDPIWDPLRSDPRFNALLIRLQLPQADRSAN